MKFDYKIYSVVKEGNHSQYMVSKMMGVNIAVVVRACAAYGYKSPRGHGDNYTYTRNSALSLYRKLDKIDGLELIPFTRFWAERKHKKRGRKKKRIFYNPVRVVNSSGVYADYVKNSRSIPEEDKLDILRRYNSLKRTGIVTVYSSSPAQNQ